MFPVFHIEERNSGQLVGTVSSTHVGKEAWVEEGSLGYLKHGLLFVFGRWQRNGDRWAFAPDSPCEALADSDLWDVFDLYWGERAELVLDERMTWTKQPFTIDAGNEHWDHEHCAVCTETIGGGGQAEAFVTSADTWVCESCFHLYIKPRSLAFITPQI